MTDTTNENSKSKWSIAFASGGIVIIVGIILFFVFRPKSSAPVEPPPLPSLTDTPDTPPPLQRVNIFLFNLDTLRLVRAESQVHLSEDTTERLKQVINALIDANIADLINPIPRGTTLNEAYIDSQSTAYLDFSGELRDGHMGGMTAELLTVNAILKTVQTNFPSDIKRVYILINHQEADTIAGHVDISEPLSVAALIEAP